MNVVVDGGKGVADYDSDYFGASWFVDYRPEEFSSASVTLDDFASSAADPAISLEADAANAVRLPILYASLAPVHSMSYVHTLRTTDLEGDWRTVVNRLISRYPGMLLIIGNEPDRQTYQDDQLPIEYAQTYHDVYEYVKKQDPTINVAIAGVVQPTPLRLKYLDMVLDSYEQLYGVKMPIDVWTVHAFILREVSASDYPPDSGEVWGAGIPPGVSDYKNDQRIYNVSEHGDINILKQLVRDFRRWMQQRGYRDKPLLVTEYGILMPPDYDAGNGLVYDHEFVSQFLRETTEFFFTATDSSMGYPADGNRLVQAWAWYALNNVVNGYLVEHDSGAVTPLGDDFAALSAKYGSATTYVDLAMRAASSSGTSIPSGVAGEKVTVLFSIQNRGNEASEGAMVRFWLGDPSNGGKLLTTTKVSRTIRARCQREYNGETTVTLPALSAGAHTITVTVQSTGASDPIAANNVASFELVAGPTTGTVDAD